MISSISFSNESSCNGLNFVPPLLSASSYPNGDEYRTERWSCSSFVSAYLRSWRISSGFQFGPEVFMYSSISCSEIRYFLTIFLRSTIVLFHFDKLFLDPLDLLSADAPRRQVYPEWLRLVTRVEVFRNRAEYPASRRTRPFFADLVWFVSLGDAFVSVEIGVLFLHGDPLQRPRPGLPSRCSLGCWRTAACTGSAKSCPAGSWSCICTMWGQFGTSLPCAFVGKAIHHGVHLDVEQLEQVVDAFELDHGPRLVELLDLNGACVGLRVDPQLSRLYRSQAGFVLGSTIGELAFRVQFRFL